MESDRAGRTAFVELRHTGFRCNGPTARERKATMILDLADDADGQGKGFESEIRNRIRKAERRSLEPSIGRLDLLDDLYGVFARNMCDPGAPVLVKRLFRNVLEAFPDTLGYSRSGI